MSRVQLALNVSNIDEAVAFYSDLFKTEPNKVKPGYANFAVADPPLKLVLIENAADAGSLNHLGIEVESVDDVPQGGERTTCCYAVQDKVWVEGPDNRPWEIYAVVEDAEVMTDCSCC
ncbi:MAG TPA: ArsI/CadI family heavy metal resistance metalloenzyme [Acidimicrobiales bacterium]|nr:ArsI/CadI family heavy metal resistance metalloenzyme [Acidimicrobiales bacterium]